MKTWLVQHSSGRVLLHLVCLLRDGKVRWHWAGIVREFRHATPLHAARATAASL